VISIVENIDNMEFMAKYPDKYFDLAIVDPPYGLGIDGQKLNNTNKNPKHNRKSHLKKNWDNSIPTEAYFNELKRISKYQIIWGGNYFTQYLEPVKGWVIWYKGQNGLTMSDCEMAWSNTPTVTRQVTINRFELTKQNTFHPTEKPIKLYTWLLQNYAKSGFKILDTHLGSGSSRIAAHDLGFDFYGCELDKDYYDAQEKRFAKHVAQLKLFAPVSLPDQIVSTLFDLPNMEGAA
jgi:site-specific DNA-methyltransferase (adenine-specific)